MVTICLSLEPLPLYRYSILDLASTHNERPSEHARGSHRGVRRAGRRGARGATNFDSGSACLGLPAAFGCWLRNLEIPSQHVNHFCTSRAAAARGRGQIESKLARRQSSCNSFF